MLLPQLLERLLLAVVLLLKLQLLMLLQQQPLWPSPMLCLSCCRLSSSY